MSKPLSRILIACLTIGFMVTEMACAQKSEPEQPEQVAVAAQTSTPTSQPSNTGGTSSQAAGVSWTIPAGWTTQGARPMRVATYTVPAKKDGEAGECAIFFFGTGQGGDIKANVARWRTQFESPDGKLPALNQQKSTVNGISYTTLSIKGTYLASMGPMFQSGTAKKPGYMMLGAIIEAPQGNVFIKATGPEQTMIDAEKDFKGMLTSLRK